MNKYIILVLLFSIIGYGIGVCAIIYNISQDIDGYNIICPESECSWHR